MVCLNLGSTRVRSALIAAFLAITAPATTCAAPPALTAAPLDELLVDVNHPNTPGCAIAIARAGEPTFTRAYGVTNLEHPEPITQDTVFEAGSVSKQFTAAAIALLATQGRLSLDDDIRRYVPEFPDYGTPITIRELLTHESGLRNWDDLVALQGYPRGTRLYTQDAILALLARQPHLNFTPGSEFLYSNSNYIVAAVIVARVSGMPFDEFSRRNLFGPLGMTHTLWRTDSSAVIPNRATAYENEHGTWTVDMPFENVVGPGGLLTTTGDLLRWNDNLSHPTAATAAWVALMTQPGQIAGGITSTYALGLELGSVRGTPVIAHDGATAGYRAYLARVPSAGASVAILCNAGNVNTSALGPIVTAFALTGSTEPPPVERHRTPHNIRQTVGLAGIYRVQQTGDPVDVTINGSGITVDGRGPTFFTEDGVHLHTIAGTREGTVTYEHGRAVDIHLTRIGNAPIDLVPRVSWNPDATALAAFAGDYTNAELGARYTAHVDGRTLVLTGPTGRALHLTPSYPDAFTADDVPWLVIFTRDSSGTIVRFSVTTDRSRDIQFFRGA